MFFSESRCIYACVVSEWVTDDVCSWLRDLDLEEHCDTFRSHDIRGRELLTLARCDLKVTAEYVT